MLRMLWFHEYRNCYGSTFMPSYLMKKTTQIRSGSRHFSIPYWIQGSPREREWHPTVEWKSQPEIWNAVSIDLKVTILLAAYLAEPRWMDTDNSQKTEWTSCRRKGMNPIDPLAEWKVGRGRSDGNNTRHYGSIQDLIWSGWRKKTFLQSSVTSIAFTMPSLALAIPGTKYYIIACF